MAPNDALTSLVKGYLPQSVVEIDFLYVLKDG